MTGQPDGDSTAARLARADYRNGQALALVDQALRGNRGNRALVDVLLDVRNALDPPART